MFEHELYKIRSADLVRAADDWRLARQAVRAARTATRAAESTARTRWRRHPTDPGPGPERHLFGRAA